MDALLQYIYMDRSFEMGDFYAEKGFVTISLGLMYHFMALSQPPSRDTVPLNFGGN
jgi:hypothetical protein